MPKYVTKYAERYYRSRDGLKLYYREYAGDPSKVPVLYLPGLTRNSSDFDRSAQLIAPGRIVISADQRGRGNSEADPNWLNYHPGVYVDDMCMLLRERSLDRVIVIGTSLGGVMAMLMASMRPQQLAGVVLNDIGPEVDVIGARRIQGYICHAPNIRTWEEASAHVKQTFGTAYPDLSEPRWREFTSNSFVTDAAGQPRLAYDPKIGELMRFLPYGVMPPMWFAYSALRPIPTLAIRGALSDLLSEATFERMKRDNPNLMQLTVANRGHAPLLHERQCHEAIDRFLADLP